MTERAIRFFKIYGNELELISQVLSIQLKGMAAVYKIEDRMICEIQVRSKLQNAWSEFTHELHCKIPTEYQADYDTAFAVSPEIWLWKTTQPWLCEIS